MIEEIKSFLNKCNDNEELKSFAELLIVCWIRGTNTMYCNIEDDKNISIIKEFFKTIYKYEHENFYSIKKLETSSGWKEYEIKWHSLLVDTFRQEELMKQDDWNSCMYHMDD